ncbi:MAG TPA: TIGR01777 family oxidoreductase [Streptosporangiaceae bacterium]|nr:TIGR01777 family oxidoreductase [Streptosporangiaceae bacterium]
MKIAITGSSGLIGSALTRHLRERGHEVLRLVRRPPNAADEAQWNPQPPTANTAGNAAGNAGADAGGAPPAEPALPALEGVDAVVNLAGAPIAGGRWTAARKREIRASRVDRTRALAAMLAGLRQPPAVLLSGSAIGWYGDTGDRAVTESAPAGSGFLSGIVRDWEGATTAAERAGIRVVHLRSGIVLSRRGGVLGPLLPLFRLGLGARLGPGTQYMSWIAITDLAGALSFLIDRPDIAGPVNLTTPNPVTNAEFTSALGAALGRPAILRVPSPALRLALGEAAGEILASVRILPGRLTGAGFEFRYPGIESALVSELRPR